MRRAAKIELARLVREPRICRTCEYWDAGGEKARETATLGDCHNRRSPRFTSAPGFTCDGWHADTGSLVSLTIPPR